MPAALDLRQAAQRVLTAPALFCPAVGLYIVVALVVDRQVGASGQLLIGAVTWAFLLAACFHLAPADRARVAVVVVAATCGEVLGSLVLGLYTYRLENLPSFVPPGHGLVYLVGARFAASALVRANERTVVRIALVVGAAWAVAGLLGPRVDVLGAVTMAALAAFMLRGRAPTLYAGVFLAVGLLELYGTAMGTWTWAAQAPGMGFPIGNPPSGIAGGYCVFDAAALALAPAVLHAARVPRRLAPWRAAPSEA